MSVRCVVPNQVTRWGLAGRDRARRVRVGVATVLAVLAPLLLATTQPGAAQEHATGADEARAPRASDPPTPCSAPSPTTSSVDDAGDRDRTGSVGTVTPRQTAPDGTWVGAQLAQQTQQGDNGEGFAIDIDGGVAAVSSGGESVYIYAQDQGGPDAWGFVCALTKANADGKGSHRWGQALALEAGVLAVGDPDDDCGVTGDLLDNCVGQVVLFTMSDVDEWAYWTSLKPRDLGLDRYNNLGTSVDLEIGGSAGSFVVAGAPGFHDDPLGSIPSYPYVAMWDLGATPGTGTPTSVLDWRPTIANSGIPVGGDPQFGHSVAIDDDYVFIGVPGSNTVCMAQYYTKSGASSSSWHTSNCMSGGSGSADFGWAVDFDATTGLLAVGAPGNKPGAAALFQTSSTPGSLPTCVIDFNGNCFGVWSSLGESSVDAQFGTSVQLSADGEYLVVGAPGTGSGSPAGQVFVFQADQPSSQGGGWGQVDQFGLDDSAPSGSKFGTSVSIGTAADGSTPLIGVGAPGQSNDQPPSKQGFAYVFGPLGPSTMDIVQQVQGPSVITPGEAVTFTVTVTNVAGVGTPAGPAVGLSLTSWITYDRPEDIDEWSSASIEVTDGLGSAADTPGFWSCAVLPQPTCNAQAAYPAGATTTFTVSFTPESFAGAWTGLSQAIWSNPTPGGSTFATADFALLTPLAGEVATTIEGPGAGVAPGQTATFSVDVTAGNADIESPVVTFQPSLQALQGAPFTEVTSATLAGPPGWACQPAAAGGQAATCTKGLLARDETATFTASVGLAPVLSVTDGVLAQLTGQVDVGWLNGPDGPTSLGDPPTATVDVVAPLRFTATQTPASPLPVGTAVSIDVDLENQIGDDVTLRQVAFASPFGFAAVTGSGPAGWDCTSGPSDEGLVCIASTPVSLSPASSLRFAVTADYTGPHDGLVTMQAKVSEPVELTVVSAAPPTKTERSADASVLAGTSVVLGPGADAEPAVFETTGLGPAAVEGVRYRLDPAPGLEVERLVLPDTSSVVASALPSAEPPASDGGWQCWRGDATRLLCRTGDPLAQGETHRLTAMVSAPPGTPAGDVGLELHVTSAGPDPDPSNDRAELTVTITAPAAPSVDEPPVRAPVAPAVEPSSAAGDPLPVTGAESAALLAAAAALLVMGSALLVGRRRARPAGPAPTGREVAP